MRWSVSILSLGSARCGSFCVAAGDCEAHIAEGAQALHGFGVRWRGLRTAPAPRISARPLPTVRAARPPGMHPSAPGCGAPRGPFAGRTAPAAGHQCRRNANSAGRAIHASQTNRGDSTTPHTRMHPRWRTLAKAAAAGNGLESFWFRLAGIPHNCAMVGATSTAPTGSAVVLAPGSAISRQFQNQRHAQRGVINKEPMLILAVLAQRLAVVAEQQHRHGV